MEQSRKQFILRLSLSVVILLFVFIIGFWTALWTAHKAEKNGGGIYVKNFLPFVSNSENYERLTEESTVEKFLNIRTAISKDSKSATHIIIPNYRIDDLHICIIVYDNYGKIIQSNTEKIGKVKKNETYYITTRLSLEAKNFDATILKTEIHFVDGTVSY